MVGRGAGTDSARWQRRTRDAPGGAVVRREGLEDRVRDKEARFEERQVER